MKWEKKSEKLRSKNISYKRNGFKITRKSLVIRNFVEKNEGLYECHIELGKYNWTDNVKINITMKGKFFTTNSLNSRDMKRFNRHKNTGLKDKK